MTTDANDAAWLLDRQLADGAGARPAFRVEGRTTTYDDLQAEVWRAHHALRALDARRGERVALVVDDELAFPAWFLGALRAGVIPVPLSTMLMANDLAAIVADSGAGTVVVSSGYRSYLAGMVKASPDLRHAVVVEGPAGDAGIPVHAWSDFDDTSPAELAHTPPDAPAFWLYSSGTTGVPKAVMHRHGSLRATAETYARSVLGVGPEDRCLSVAKLFFAFGLGNSLTFPLSVGGCAILNPRRPVPAEVVDLVRAEVPTLFFASPGFVAALLDADVPPAAFASVRATVTAGERLPAELQRRFQDRFGHPVLDGIGTTEALHIFISNTRGATRPGTSGLPVPGYEARLMDADAHEVVATETPGYLQVRGPSLATGYWCRDAATRASFQGEWLATGDVYTRDEDGYWTFLGRNSDMIKAGGIWVSPAEVESVLIEHPDVLEAAVVGTRNAEELEEVAAFLVARQGHEIDIDSVDKHCRSGMAAFKRPRRVVVVDELPKTATGKVKRFELRDRLDSNDPR
jgi:benzoate-CoA ligase family protein